MNTHKQKQSVGRTPISSDDPNSVALLQGKLAGLLNLQDIMKRANVIIRKHGNRASAIPELVEMGITEENAAALLRPDFCGRIGFPAYEIANNNAKIRSVKQRIDELSAKTFNSPDTEHDCGTYTVIEAFSDNRVRVVFSEKPPEFVRTVLKRGGFKWSPTAGAWQRMYRADVVRSLVVADGFLRERIESAPSDRQ